MNKKAQTSIRVSTFTGGLVGSSIPMVGPDGWRRMTAKDVEEFVANLGRLFEGIEHEE